MKLSPDFCFAIPEGGGTLLSWSKMAVSALATKPMFQAAGWSGKRKKAYPFPFRETTQKFMQHITSGCISLGKNLVT